jgi:DNA-binding CsgD family transcriptional regulator
MSENPRYGGVAGTPREAEVIERILQGESRREVARAVGCHHKTVQNVAKRNSDLIKRKGRSRRWRT